ncbi:hypothetical protein AXW83_07220 [Bosea sp. PAMC 26642]|nr:hypothetical protein AXW83_07220 [Bosea sp. PAMC 26642]
MPPAPKPPIIGAPTIRDGRIDASGHVIRWPTALLRIGFNEGRAERREARGYNSRFVEPEAARRDLATLRTPRGAPLIGDLTTPGRAYSDFGSSIWKLRCQFA